jgi:hypothetical protein
MAEVDYGYGEDLDYGYGAPDMVAEDQDMDAMPQSTMMDNNDPENGGSSATTTMMARRGPKRRCSVTKFSLENENGASTPTVLTAASVIDAMRQGMVPPPSDGNDDVAVVDLSTTATTTTSSDRRYVTPQNSSDFCYADAGDENDDEQQGEAELIDENCCSVDVEENGTMNETSTTKGKKNGVLRILSLRRK